MAISAVFRYLIRNMRENRLLPERAALLEIGEANWYGEINRDELVEDVERFVDDASRREMLIRRIDELLAEEPETISFDAVKVFYDIFFAPSQVQAIDFHGTPAAQQLDLNRPVSLSQRFDLVINHGTAEHIFNIAQVFRTIHDWTEPGGMMIHESPFVGWINHGFYNLQPTLFYDVAEVNQYRMLGMFIENLSDSSIQQVGGRESVYELAKAKQIPANAMLFTVMVKGPDDAFRVPTQGYYRGALSAAGLKAWKDLR